MAKTDFFDDDLIQQRNMTRRIKLGPGDEGTPPVEAPPPGEALGRTVSDLNLTRMAKHKQAVEGQVATAMQELERLKKRQEDLEQEKKDLEDLRRKQAEYERGKREMSEHFTQSLLLMEKEEVEAGRRMELLAATRKRFKALLADVEALREETWPEDQIREELSKALVILDDARQEYNRAMVKIELVMDQGGEKAPEIKPVIFEDTHVSHDLEKTFGYWFKTGLALSLPLIVTFAILALVFIFMQFSGML